MLEPALADIRDGSGSGFPELPSDGLRDQLRADLLGVPLRGRYWFRTSDLCRVKAALSR